CGTDETAFAATFVKVEALSAELAGANPTPVERLLAERAALCWAASYYADALLATNRGKVSHRVEEHLERRAERHQRRYTSALKSLAAVRRAAAPAMGVSVRARQANVAGLAGVAVPAAAPDDARAEREAKG